MQELKELRFHGRGGQGAYTASQIISHAALFDDKYAQSFPEFGAERQGAPIKAYARVSPEKIDIHSEITDADVIIVIDPTLIQLSTEGYRENSIFIASTPESPEELRKQYNIPEYVTVWTVDGVKIARENIGRPIPNTTMLGAFAKASEEKIVSLKSLKEATKEVGRERGWPEDSLPKNIQAMEEAYNKVKQG